MKTLAPLAAACLAVALPGALQAAPKKAPPVDVTVQNTCGADLALKLGSTGIKVAAGQTAVATVAPEKPGEALPLVTEATPPVELARLTFAGAGKWNLKLAECAEGKADVFAQQTVDPNAGSPLASAQVHYRARVRGFLEYQAGDMGAFKPLSIAMTSYVEAKPGELSIQLRKRGAASGPVVANVKKSVTVLPGRKQVIEVDFGGTTPFVSVEDEGPIK